jgi:hypothetical protein
MVRNYNIDATRSILIYSSSGYAESPSDKGDLLFEQLASFARASRSATDRRQLAPSRGLHDRRSHPAR